MLHCCSKARGVELEIPPGAMQFTLRKTSECFASCLCSGWLCLLLCRVVVHAVVGWLVLYEKVAGLHSNLSSYSYSYIFTCSPEAEGQKCHERTKRYWQDRYSSWILLVSGMQGTSKAIWIACQCAMPVGDADRIISTTAI
jgi:membrane protein YqaA with SNARE-associated domain